MQQTLTRMVELLKQNKEVVDAIKAGDARGIALGEFINALNFTIPVQVLTIDGGIIVPPSQSSKEVQLVLDDKQLQRIAKMMVPELLRSGGAATDVQSMENVKQLALGVVMHMSA